MHDAQIAQLVEQRTENPRVTGSIPVPVSYTHLWERYLNDVVSHVRFAFDRRKIRQELAEHMEDLYEDLLSQDIDEMCIRDRCQNVWP